MAKPITEKQDAQPTDEMHTIEHWAQLNQVIPWAMAGLKARNKWGVGKMVTESEFKAALNQFLSGPMSSRRAEK
jgi:hypothetical protein